MYSLLISNDTQTIFSYIVRMKEFERERRLRVRENRVAATA